MGDAFPMIKVAAVQAAPVFLDREASVAKACRLIAEAGAHEARLVVFPEAWLLGYPVWLDISPGAALWDHPPAKEVFTRLVANAVEVPGPATEALASAAAQAGCALVMGINERERGRPSGTLYNSIVTFGPDGSLLGRHRKLIPTYTERLVWGRGDGSTLDVYDTPLGRIGGLVCWEHWMLLARHAMHATGEQMPCRSLARGQRPPPGRLPPLRLRGSLLRRRPRLGPPPRPDPGRPRDLPGRRYRPGHAPPRWRQRHHRPGRSLPCRTRWL